MLIRPTFRQYRINRVLKELTGKIPPPDPGLTELPPASASIIIEAARPHLPYVKSDKQFALIVHQIYESLFTRPPRWPATIGLLALYAFAIAVPLIPLVAIHRELLPNIWSHHREHRTFPVADPTPVPRNPTS